MKYNYNGNLTNQERINEVALDIINYNPDITMKEALVIATLEPPITTEVDDSIKFRRLFNILFIKRDYKNFIKTIAEINKLDKNNVTIQNALIKLSEYANNKTNFPYYNEIFN